MLLVVQAEGRLEPGCDDTAVDSQHGLVAVMRP